MRDIIQQRIPGGGLTPEEQVELCLEAVRTAAYLLEFSGADELESALADMQQSLVLLAAAGVLADMTFSLHDSQGVCGATVTLDPYSVDDYEEADLSCLRLLVNSEACGSIELGYVDVALAQSIVGEDWLPLSSPSLQFRQGPANRSDNEDEKHQEDDDEYNDDQA